MTNKEVYIVEAVRTPVGNFNGSLASLRADKLGEIVIKEILNKTKLQGADVSEVIMGQVLVGGCGQNPARQASINAGIPKEVPAWGVSQVCGSGLRAVALGFQSILTDDNNIVIAGGQESMSMAGHVMHLRNGTKMGDASMVDMMIKDGLTDAFNNYHMGITAENIAKKYNISRAEQDQFACQSQNKAEAAQNAGKFNDEIVPVTIANKKGDIIVNSDEFIRHGTTVEALSNLRPAFDKEGTVTAGNASGINDGAAALLIMTKEEMEKRGLKPLARIASWAHAGVAPEIMGTGPVPAVKKALEKAGWAISDLDLIEANEAFAAQAISVNKELGWDTSKVNVNGGAIAIGHPIGASGARILVTLVHEMKRRDAKKGIATLCIGGGMGVAVCVER
jgi:acetyl-CoA C-acetyltransferase